MMALLLNLLIFALIAWVLFYVITLIASLLKLPEPLKQILLIIFGIVLLFQLIGILGVHTSFYTPLWFESR